MSKRDFNNAQLQEMLDGLIPGGSHTYSKGRDVFPANAPSLLKKGKGSKVWDVFNKRYLDYGMGLKTVCLGYAHKEVDRAARKSYELGNNLSRPSVVELEAADLLIDLIDGAQMVKFAKNGSNVTTAAIKLARSYTGRKLVCIPEEQPFFSFDDWFIGSTLASTGVPSEHYSLTKKFNYGCIESIQSQFSSYGRDIAAVILEPAVLLLACEKCVCTPVCDFRECPESFAINETKLYLQKLKDICELNGTILIFDEMRTGFRWDLQGAQKMFGVTPHLSTFGKAMANGYSLSALVGMKEIMSVASTNIKKTPRTFLLSSTHGAEMGPLGAFIKVVEIHRREMVSKYLWEYGRKLKDGVRSVISEHKLLDFVKIIGPGVAPQLEFVPSQHIDSFALATFFYELMINERIIMPTISPSFAHSDRDLEFTINAFERVLGTIARADLSEISKRDTHILSPVFRELN